MAATKNKGQAKKFLQKSKPIDQFNQVRGKHYGIMDDELDFIVNYDIKYRMGRVADCGEEDG